MNKLSKDEINQALDSLVRSRKEKQLKETIRYMVADCYLSVGPRYYPWNHVPREHICSNCGKHFGEGTEKKERLWAGGRSDETHDSEVNKSDFAEILETYEDCKAAGYDVDLMMHCAECIEKYGLVPLMFRFRITDEEEYTVSYPQLEFYHKSNPQPMRWGKEKRLSEKHFFPWQYSIAISFLTELATERNNMLFDMKCREWVDEKIDRRECENEPWTCVYEAIEGILGLSIKGSK